MFESWSVEVDGPDLDLQLFMKLRNKSTKVSIGRLHEGADTIYLELLTNPNNKFCILRYELWMVHDKKEEDGKNNFYKSNIFDSFLNGNNEISRVEPNPPRSNFLQVPNSDERVGFHGDISMISNASYQAKD